MGILDDAIREHLELKRSRGATDDEVARQEAEALGPARREPAAAPSFDGGDEPLADAPLPPPDPGAAVGAEDGAPPPPPPELVEPLHAEPSLIDPIAPPPVPLEPISEREAFAPEPDPVEPEPVPEALDPERAPDPDPFAGPPTEAMHAADLPEVLPPDEPAAEAAPADPLPPEPDPDATPVRPLPPIDDDALPPAPALPPEPERQPPPATADEDVLEETPDFLQDTPEHDRLWFEQRPPRDFDFDD